ncbi:pirin family protein [Caulobacter sp. LjRoot300]|uniref:pirin family protein n=1 Tax=Caulobacter sp. LjRoot300 TaxID=3342321 RepID=UPI003ED1036C
MSFATASQTLTAAPARPRPIQYRTRGQGHGPITRLMSPGDLGQTLKPFVFLDLFEADPRIMAEGMGIHPHSGIATITVLTQGDLRFDDPDAGQGTIGYGGVEWMRAGGGVWHGKELSAGASARIQGFQLWITLPPETENAPPESQYIPAEGMAAAGPAHVILGQYEGVSSPVRAPDGVNYLLVRLAPGETWSYTPPAGHQAAWLAVASGGLQASQALSAGDMAVFAPSQDAITLSALGNDDAVFVLGSAAPHPHELHMGYYSVHTSAEALVRGENRIDELGRALAEAGDRRTPSGSTPVFR